MDEVKKILGRLESELYSTGGGSFAHLGLTTVFFTIYAASRLKGIRRRG
jgi:hypothetical protein